MVVNDNSVLTIRNVVPDDEDVYVCQAENSVGSAQAFANVQIHCKLLPRLLSLLSPIFTVEPQNGEKPLQRERVRHSLQQE